MGGIPSLWRESKVAGIKPIAGLEAYITEDRRRCEKEAVHYHITLLARNQRGFNNLCMLSSLAYTEGFYRKPRLDPEILSQYSEGIICLTGCVGGWPSQLVLQGDQGGAEDVVVLLSSLFSPKCTFVEVQYTGEQDQLVANNGLIKIAKRLDLPLVASGDSHYAKIGDYDYHDTLICVGTHKAKADDKRMRFIPRQYHVKTPEEMRKSGLPEESYINTLEIAEMCESYELPRAGGIPKLSDKQELAEMAIAGLYDRTDNAPTDEQMERLLHELDVIQNLGFQDYFLVVQDFVKFARNNGIFHGWGRGSSVGSYVAYALHITNIDPIPLGLYFERFLNPSRREPPDIDVDLQDNRRQEVIDYIGRKFGQDKVAFISTYSTLGPRQILADVCKALGKDFFAMQAVVKALPYDPTFETKDLIIDEKLMGIITKCLGKDVADCIVAFEGLQRQASIHAAGIVIDSNPMDGVIPMAVRGAKDARKTATQYEYSDLKSLGYDKFDVLGVKALRVLDNLSKRLNLDLMSIPLDDEKTYDMLCAGNAIAVFQLEGWGYRQFLKEFRPRNFDDMMMVNALYRPGPMKEGRGLGEIVTRRFKRVPVTYPHPSLEPILKSTYGIAIYQEQVMKLVQILAGWSLAEADQLRWAIGKKKKEEVAKLRTKFVDDCIAQGHPEPFADKMFNDIEFFARYGWNKAHSAAYGMVTYVSAYIKANYPEEFMCEFLNSSLGDHDKINDLIQECTRLGILVTHPDINLSEEGYIVRHNGEKLTLLAGLGAIKFLGEKARKYIVEDRNEHGRFVSVEDWRSRIPKMLCNKTAFEALRKAKAFADIPESGEGLPF
jgi:DNA polymerase-3 subunit alpha